MCGLAITVNQIYPIGHEFLQGPTKRNVNSGHEPDQITRARRSDARVLTSS